jgi:hypothetical protein
MLLLYILCCVGLFLLPFRPLASLALLGVPAVVLSLALLGLVLGVIHLLLTLGLDWLGARMRRLPWTARQWDGVAVGLGVVFLAGICVAASR